MISLNNFMGINYKEMKQFNYKLEIEIFRNSTQKFLGVQSGVLVKDLGVQKGTQTPCWLRPELTTQIQAVLKICHRCGYHRTADSLLVGKLHGLTYHSIMYMFYLLI